MFMISFQVVKPFLEAKTRKKVKFVYTDDESTKKIMEEVFEMDQLESAFGGENPETFDIQKYAQRMKEDDEKMRSFWEEASVVDSSCNNGLIMHERSLSDPSEGEAESDGTPSSSTAEDSRASTPDVGLSVATVSLEEPGHVKV